MERGNDDHETGPMAGPAAAVAITAHSPLATQTVEIPEVQGVQPIAQPLPNGRVLLVGWGAEWRPDGPDRNATIYGRDGRAELAACVGDAVSHVRTTIDGSVWVGYDDMGIFGNNGWGEAGAPPPIGSPGLIRFSPELKIEWEFPGDHSPDRIPGLSGPIDDCEAIALDGDTLWMYYYSAFPVVRIDAGRDVRAWASRAREAAVPVNVKAVVADGQHVGLAGASGRAYQKDQVVVARLEDGWTHVRSVKLVLPDSSHLPIGVTMAGLGDTLHVFAGTDWYQVGLAELL